MTNLNKQCPPDTVERWLDAHFARMAALIIEHVPFYEGFCRMMLDDGLQPPSRKDFERGLVAWVMDQTGRRALNSYAEYECSCRSLGWSPVTPEAFRRRIAKGLDDFADEMTVRLARPQGEPLQ